MLLCGWLFPAVIQEMKNRARERYNCDFLFPNLGCQANRPDPPYTETHKTANI